MTLAVLRLIGEELRKDRTARVIAQVPVAVATYLINEKREWLRTLEDKSSAELIIVPNENIQTPEYSIRRVRDDEIELPENRQATYLMPTAAEVSEPGSAQDKKPQQEPPAVATLLPATPAPIAAPAPAPARVHAAAEHGAPPAGEGFWARFKRFLIGEPAAPAEPQPAGGTASSRGARRDDTERREGRREHYRHGRHAEGARRERGERRGDGRERDRDRGRGRDGREMRDRDRSRDSQGRGGRDRVAERTGTERSASRPESAAPEDSRPSGERAAVEAAAATGEVRGERGERRGRRGRRRGRRGGGGGREGLSQAQEAPAPGGALAAEAPGNGSHDAPPAPISAPPAADRPREAADQPPVREFHSEPREAAAGHEAAPLAHFEPAPKPDVGGGKPYVVWSSAPSKDVGTRGSEE